MAVSDSTRFQVRARARSRCEYCHADEQWQFVRFTVGHVIPQSDAGSDVAENLALACRNCNERRSNRQESIDPQTGEVAHVFNPRQDVWNEHFAWSSDRVHIVGATPLGRATAWLLDMNDERHGSRIISIRQRDLADGFHPPPGDAIVVSIDGKRCQEPYSRDPASDTSHFYVKRNDLPNTVSDPFPDLKHTPFTTTIAHLMYESIGIGSIAVSPPVGSIVAGCH